MNDAVLNSKWVTIQCHAFCDDCDWFKNGGGQRTEQDIVVRAARDHVRASGHRVQLQRGQMRTTEPSP